MTVTTSLLGPLAPMPYSFRKLCAIFSARSLVCAFVMELSGSAAS